MLTKRRRWSKLGGCAVEETVEQEFEVTQEEDDSVEEENDKKDKVKHKKKTGRKSGRRKLKILGFPESKMGGFLVTFHWKLWYPWQTKCLRGRRRSSSPRSRCFSCSKVAW